MEAAQEAVYVHEVVQEDGGGGGGGGGGGVDAISQAEHVAALEAIKERAAAEALRIKVEAEQNRR